MFSTVVDIEKERGLLTLQKAESASWNSTYTCYHAEYTLGTEMFALGGLFMKYNAYILEGGNKGGRGGTPTSISILGFYDMKTLWIEFIFTGFKMPTL